MKTPLLPIFVFVTAASFLQGAPLPARDGAVPPATFYDSKAQGNDFSGSKGLAAAGFTDVHGGVATFSGGNLILTPDTSNGGSDAFLRDYVLREGDTEQVRDIGCRVVLPPNYRTGEATIGICLRFQASGSGLLLNFASGDGDALFVYSLANGVSTRQGSANLTSPYVPADPIALEARVVLDAAATLTATDLTTGQIIGFLNVPLTFGAIPAGSFGLVPWMVQPGSGHIAVASVQTYPVTVVACDGDSLTVGENSTSGKGTGSPLARCYPGVLQKLLGNRYHVFNLGRSGLTVTAMNSDAATRVDALLAGAERPPFVVLEGGTNDFGIDGSTYPPRTASQAAQIVFARLQTYWAARHAARPDVRVVDITNTPAGHPVYVRNLHSTTAFDQRRDALNELREKAASPLASGARPDFVADDAADPSIGKDGDEHNATYFQADDQTHMTDAGYAIKAAIVAKVIQQASGSQPMSRGQSGR